MKVDLTMYEAAKLADACAMMWRENSLSVSQAQFWDRLGEKLRDRIKREVARNAKRV